MKEKKKEQYWALKPNEIQGFYQPNKLTKNSQIQPFKQKAFNIVLN